MLRVKVSPLGDPGHQRLLQGPGIHFDVADHHALRQGLQAHGKTCQFGMRRDNLGIYGLGIQFDVADALRQGSQACVERTSVGQKQVWALWDYRPPTNHHALQQDLQVHAQKT